MASTEKENAAPSNTRSCSVTFATDPSAPSMSPTPSMATRRASDAGAPSSASVPPPNKRRRAEGGTDMWYWSVEELWDIDEAAILGASMLN